MFQITDTLTRRTEDHVFGEASVLYSSTTAAENPLQTPITVSTTYNLVMIGTFLVLCYMILVYRSSIIRSFAVFGSSNTFDKFLKDRNVAYDRFLKLSFYTGPVIFSVLFLRMSDYYITLEKENGLTSYLSVPALLVLLFTAIILVRGYIMLILSLAGRLTDNRGFTSDLIYFRKVYWAVCCLLSYPFAIIISFMDYRWFVPMATIIFLFAILLISWFLIRTFRMFVQQKISILFWILYLCAVEILPLSFFIALAVKGM